MPIALSIQFTRDSVHATDDPGAPHPQKLTLARRQTELGGFADELAALVRPLLPTIPGGRATWLLLVPSPLVVIAEQWVEVRTLAIPDTDRVAAALARATTLTVHASYLVQHDPKVAADVIDHLYSSNILGWKAR